ncbi:UDP-glucosyltransferase, partial [Bacillus tropicus]|nr:UDP-glucosyltransferase [Bacillus tropicus]
MLNILMVNF